MASLEEPETLLKDASRLLDEAAEQIRDLGLDQAKNIRRIAGSSRASSGAGSGKWKIERGWEVNHAGLRSADDHGGRLSASRSWFSSP